MWLKILNIKNKNLYYKVLKSISDHGCNSFRHIAKSLDITEELLKLVLQSLMEKGILILIDESKYHEEFKKSLSCKFCPFAIGCSERIPHIFYEMTSKGKELIY